MDLAHLADELKEIENEQPTSYYETDNVKEEVEENFVGRTTVPLTCQEYPRFDITNDPNQLDEMMKFLDEYGFVIVANVANNEQVSKFLFSQEHYHLSLFID